MAELNLEYYDLTPYLSKDKNERPEGVTISVSPAQPSLFPNEEPENKEMEYEAPEEEIIPVQSHYFPAANREGLMSTLEYLQEAETETMEQGQKEYARASNVFANFNRIAQDLGLTPEQVLIVYAVKHMDGIISWVNGYRSQREDVSGRIKDLRVYLAILNAMALAYEADQTTSNPAGFGR